MKISFEIEKVLKYKTVEVELTEKQVAVIQKMADKRDILFEDAFRLYADSANVLWDIMWETDEEDYEYDIWDVKVKEN
jgi:hypothetical protein